MDRAARRLGLGADDTLARLDVGGRSLLGRNSGAVAGVLTFPYALNAVTRTHAEGEVFQRFFNKGFGGETGVLFVNRGFCASCGKNGGVGSLLRATGLDRVTAVTPDGTFLINATQLVAILKSKWVRYFVKHEPAKTLTHVKCHVLAMNGEKDLQVLCDLNLKPMEKALKQGSPASFKIVRLPDVNHMFQETRGSGSPDEYGKIEETVSPGVLKIIGEWVSKVTR